MRIGILVALAACQGPSWAEREARDDGTYDPALPHAAPAGEAKGTGSGTLGPPAVEPRPSMGESVTREGSAGPPIQPYSPLEERVPVTREGGEPMAPAEFPGGNVPGANDQPPVPPVGGD